jgi:hypothetical protein
MNDGIQYMEITVRPENFGTKNLGGQAQGQSLKDVNAIISAVGIARHQVLHHLVEI